MQSCFSLKKMALVVFMATSLSTSAFAATNNNEIQFFGATNLQEIPLNSIKSFNENPFGLVYANAITENVKGKVNIHSVNYFLNGNKIAANIYTPANYDPNLKYPAIVVAHPNGGVKEQVAGLYAQKLAEQGFITITADASFQGASGGQPRNLDNPAFRVEDIHGMADIIANFAGVDDKRIGALGICGGGGYTIKASQTDKRLKAVATLSMFNSGIVRKDGFLNIAKDTTLQRLHEASDLRAKEALGSPITRTPATENAQLTQEQLDKMPDLYREGFLYYGNTHRHPNSTFQYTLRSNLDLFTFDARENMELIDQPLLMMAGSNADTLYMTEECYELATGTEHKELFKVEGATHIQTYFVPEYVETFVSKLESFYKQYL